MTAILHENNIKIPGFCRKTMRSPPKYRAAAAQHPPMLRRVLRRVLRDFSFMRLFLHPFSAKYPPLAASRPNTSIGRLDPPPEGGMVVVRDPPKRLSHKPGIAASSAYGSLSQLPMAWIFPPDPPPPRHCHWLSRVPSRNFWGGTAHRPSDTTPPAPFYTP